MQDRTDLQTHGFHYLPYTMEIIDSQLQQPEVYSLALTVLLSSGNWKIESDTYPKQLVLIYWQSLVFFDVRTWFLPSYPTLVSPCACLLLHLCFPFLGEWVVLYVKPGVILYAWYFVFLDLQLNSSFPILFSSKNVDIYVHLDFCRFYIPEDNRIFLFSVNIMSRLIYVWHVAEACFLGLNNILECHSLFSFSSLSRENVWENVWEWLQMIIQWIWD